MRSSVRYNPGDKITIDGNYTIRPSTIYYYEKLGVVDGWSVYMLQKGDDATKYFNEKHGGQVFIKIIDGLDIDGYPDYSIIDSWMFTNDSFKKQVCQLIIKYNKDRGRTSRWNRSLTACVDEWTEHNLLYAVFKYSLEGIYFYEPIPLLTESARNVDLDAKGYGYLPEQLKNELIEWLNKL